MANEKRLIDANALFEFLKEQRDKETGAYSKGRNNGINVAIGAIRNEQICLTVDAVAVVRCKDCKHWKPSGSMAGNSEDDLQPIGGCIWANCCRRANDFCSYGERKDDGT